jgi:hypothetical protein
MEEMGLNIAGSSMTVTVTKPVPPEAATSSAPRRDG